MGSKLIAIGIGYLFGCFLTAEIVARKFAGKPAAEVGDTGNPGMANMMDALGFLPGILTLAGDLGKCIAAALISYCLFKEEGRIILFYAGLGCTLGHDFPFWRGFRGGKGVATSSMAMALYSFPIGLGANIAGLLVVIATKYLSIAGPVIPLVFTIAMLVRADREAAVISGILTILALYSHMSSNLGIRSGNTEKTDLMKGISNKLKR